jgi:endoglucanase
MKLARPALVAAGVVAVAAGLLVVVPNASAAAGCRVDYTVQNQWSTGFSGNVNITNLGDPLSSWRLEFGFADGQRITDSWNATWTQSAAQVTATNLSWNGAVGTGATVAAGFNASWSGRNTVPTAFTLNGVTCTGGVVTTPPTTTPPTTTPPTTAPPTTTPPTTTPPPNGAAPALHVSGNRLLTAAGAPLRLLGVNRSGGEFACIQGNGIWDGPMDQASVTAIRSWKVRAVRVPLNESCWLGSSDVPAGGVSGTAYQSAVKSYVQLLIANGINPIIEMHWNVGQYTGPGSGCSDVKATCQKPMPDAQFAPQFWTSVSNAFKGNDAVVFDLFNEPYPDFANNFSNATAAWTCFRDGGTCQGITYQVAGFQSLVNAVRSAGATNVILVGGLSFSNDLGMWLQFRPTDPRNNLAAFAHIYNFNSCANTACWDSKLAPVAAQVPLTLSEIGENDCAHGFVDGLMSWADLHGVGYLGWTWNTWPCNTGPALISDYNGTPTPFGQGVHDHLASVSN